MKNIKTAFPIFSNTGGAKDLIYLDNASTTQKPLQVIEAVRDYYSHFNANVHRGIYSIAQRATDTYEDVRRKVAGFLNAATPKEIVFTNGTTDGINLVAQSFLEPRLNRGDEVLISAMEHHANLIPWQVACQRKKAKLKVLPIDQEGNLVLEQLPKLLGPKTKMMAIVHISNTLGTINPVEEIIRIARKYHVPVLVDAAQSMATREINVKNMDCDFLVFSGHKIFGPTGIGILYGKKEHLDHMEPNKFGGEMIRNVTFEKTEFDEPPYRFEGGTPNIAGVVGLGAAIDFIENLDRGVIEKQQKKLLEYATDKLSKIEKLRIIGKAKQKAGIISFTLDGIHPHDLATFLDEDRICVRAGHHCTQPLMEFFNVPATTRISFSIYNQLEEIDKLAESIKKVKRFFGT